MIAVNYTTLRDNMKDCFDRVADSCETMIVIRKSTNMVIMSEDSYNSLMETLYLLGNKANPADFITVSNKSKADSITANKNQERGKTCHPQRQ